MLVLVLIVELTIAGRRLDFTTIWADDWRSSAEAAARRSKDQDILCLGDSLVKFAVLPQEIKAKTGLKSYNLALNAGTMPSTYFMLRRAIESGARPRAIVADFCPLMIPENPRKLIRLYPELATVAECFEFARIADDSVFFSMTLMAKLLPSYKCRFEIRDSIMAAMDGRRASPWPRYSSIWASWNTQNGAQPMTPAPSVPILDPGMIATLSPSPWECDPINAVYFEKFLSLARSQQIPVFWLIPPLSPALESSRTLHKSDEAYTRFARSAMKRHPEVVVLDARRSGYEFSVYIDALHLDQRGAKVLTDDLASIVSERLRTSAQDSDSDSASASRWVEMPAFAGRSGAVARAGGGVGGSTR